MTVDSRAASRRELECARALQGNVPRKFQEGTAIERGRTAGELDPFNGLLDEGIDVTTRTWSLPELEMATTCLYQWFVQVMLGGHERVSRWSELRRAALRAAIYALEQGHDPLEAADIALEDCRAALGLRNGWWPGPLWASDRLEMLRSVERILAQPDCRPAGWSYLESGDDHQVTIRAGTYQYALALTADQLDQTPHGLILTSYQSHDPHRQAGLDRDAQLALLMFGTGAVAARTLDWATGRYSGLVHQSVRPTAESPITLARQTLSVLGDRLRAGRLEASPDRYRCPNCVARSLCRFGWRGSL